MFSPRPPLVSIRGRQNGCVVDHGALAKRRTVRGVRSGARTLRRASFISSALRRPCCFSHGSERSIASKSRAVDFPDFTRGKWISRKPLGIVKVLRNARLARVHAPPETKLNVLAHR